MPEWSHEITFPMLWVNGCQKCSGTQQLCKDPGGYYRKCLNCGTTKDEPTELYEKPQEPKMYDSMDQSRLPGFRCHVSEDCVSCPLQRCENATFANLVRDTMLNTRAKRMRTTGKDAAGSASARTAEALKLNPEKRILLQEIREGGVDSHYIPLMVGYMGRPASEDGGREHRHQSEMDRRTGPDSGDDGDHLHNDRGHWRQ